MINVDSCAVIEAVWLQSGEFRIVVEDIMLKNHRASRCFNWGKGETCLSDAGASRLS